MYTVITNQVFDDNEQYNELDVAIRRAEQLALEQASSVAVVTRNGDFLYLEHVAFGTGVEEFEFA